MPPRPERDSAVFFVSKECYSAFISFCTGLSLPHVSITSSAHLNALSVIQSGALVTNLFVWIRNNLLRSRPSFLRSSPFFTHGGFLPVGASRFIRLKCLFGGALSVSQSRAISRGVAIHSGSTKVWSMNIWKLLFSILAIAFGVFFVVYGVSAPPILV